MTQRAVLGLALLLASLPARTVVSADAGAGGPAGPADFDFLQGRWAVIYDNSQPGIPPDVPGTWIASKQADGRVLYDEFRLFGPKEETVFLGATYRVFDQVESRWNMRYVGLSLLGGDGVMRHPAEWAELSAWREGPRIRVDQRGEQSLLRITYYDVSRDHFRWKADVSRDGGKTWNQGQLRIEATRVAGAVAH